MKQRQDLDEFMYIMEITRSRLHGMGEHISPELFGDLVLDAFTHDVQFRAQAQLQRHVATSAETLDAARWIAPNTTPTITRPSERRLTRSSKRSKAEEGLSASNYVLLR